MRIRVAECTVRYEGRLNAFLPTATRLVMVKADGCVAVHADGGAYKPLNWMNAPNTFTEEGDSWIVVNRSRSFMSSLRWSSSSSSEWDFTMRARSAS